MFVSVFESRPNTKQSFYIFIVSYVFFTKFSIYCISALLAHGRWLSPGTPASSTTKTGDIAEILLKVALNTKNQSNQPRFTMLIFYW
jgi:hypothetical protein